MPSFTRMLLESQLPPVATLAERPETLVAAVDQSPVLNGEFVIDHSGKGQAIRL